MLIDAYRLRFSEGRIAYLAQLIEVMVSRTCKALNSAGQPCRQAPLTEGDFCYWHDPENEKEAGDARRLGGMNRKREQTLAVVYDVQGLATPEDILRWYELAQMQNLSLDNSVARNRAIVDTATAALRLFQVSDLARQMEQIRSVIEGRMPSNEAKKRRWGLF